MAQRWQIAIDRGGTFTDCVGVDPAGRLHVVKVLSNDRAPLDGIRRLMGLSARAPIPACDVRMGTTLATNALLERRGRRTALLITRGFGDLLEIGTQARSDLFAIEIRKPRPLPERVIEVDARHDARGLVLLRPETSAVLETLAETRALGITSLAVVVLNAHRNPELELLLGSLAERIGFEHIALSHRVSPELGLLARADTTVLDAYLTPVLREYIDALREELPGSTLLGMQSGGGLVDARHLSGPNAIFSGPAGGLVALGEVTTRSGRAPAIGFDMGGTSTDVSRFAGELPRLYETEVAGVRVRSPMMDVHTIAAGGGSICRFEAGRLSVGPDSAGARPGPLAYGDPAATELTLTDVNILLGRLPSAHFPFSLDAARAEAKLAALLKHGGAGAALSALELLEGFVQVANSAMAEAIRRVSIARGHDVRDHTLVVFGGAGGQHACGVARHLGIHQIVFHPLAGVLSAVGIGLADRFAHSEADGAGSRLDAATLEELGPRLAALELDARAALERDGASATSVDCVHRIDLRYVGSDARLTLGATSAPELERTFHGEHQREFGHVRPGHPIEIVALRVEARAPAPGFARALEVPPRSATRTAGEPRRVCVAGHWLDSVPCLEREALEPGTRLAGPLLVVEPTGTIFVEPGFELSVTSDGLVELSATPLTLARTQHSAVDAATVPHDRDSLGAVDPVLLEIMSGLYMSIAEQMGEALRRTAFSTNIRERLDFSCAVFDAAGGLVANAPHIPVHLGAMSESVRAILLAHPELHPGDVFATNDPSAGGSHLPDITVVSPVHDAQGELVFFTACRGHHADVGGITPGSMPAFSTSLEQEGVVLSGLRIVNHGVFDERAVRAALAAGPHPARDPDANVRDLQAQIAANATGARLLGNLVRAQGLGRVRAYMRHVQDDAAAHVASQIERIEDGIHRFTDELDDGTRLEVAITVTGPRMLIDFSGTAAEVPGNLNAPRAVTVAAVLYFLRSLVGASIPLNGGCLRPVELRILPGSLLDPSPGRAVCGGNVETSQRVVDVLFGALGLAAASQGTMNNLTFGGSGFSYYETIAGGAGATAACRGASAVHTHMTNTRITDAEVLESRFPVRLWRFQVRRGSGGSGQQPGGDGVLRELEFLKPAQVAILSERRARAPFGLAGGLPGAPGQNLLDGRDVGGHTSFDVRAGARLLIATPGGGGYGPPRGSSEQPDQG